MKIYVDYTLNAACRRRLDHITAGEDVYIARREAHQAADQAAFIQSDVALGEVPREMLPLAQRLQWLQLPSVGIDYYRHVDWETLGSRITCTNLKGVFTEAVIQTTMAGILGLYRGLDELITLQSRREWKKMAIRPRLRVLSGAHVLLLGTGDLATAVQSALSPYGCRFTRFARTSGDIHTLEALDAALPQADIVCATLPDTPSTRGLMNRARVERLKVGALFVNIGRGSLLDEGALIDALRTGRLAGAVLDVTRREPLPPEDPLWSTPRLLLTQHTAAGSNREYEDAIELFGQNLDRFRRGQPLLNVVDWARGY